MLDKIEAQKEKNEVVLLIQKADLKSCTVRQLAAIINTFDALNVPMLSGVSNWNSENSKEALEASTGVIETDSEIIADS